MPSRVNMNKRLRGNRNKLPHLWLGSYYFRGARGGLVYKHLWVKLVVKRKYHTGLKAELQFSYSHSISPDRTLRWNSLHSRIGWFQTRFTPDDGSDEDVALGELYKDFDKLQYVRLVYKLFLEVISTPEFYDMMDKHFPEDFLVFAPGPNSTYDYR